MQRHFDFQIEKLKTRIIKMCSLVDEQVEFAIKTINEENHELAEVVINRDKKVDKYDLKIDKICQKIFALNQPVAMDLRLIMSALTINTNLERIGDLAVNIVEHFKYMGKKPVFFERTKFDEMSIVAREMIKNSIDAFIENDPKLAQKVILTDQIVDAFHKDNHKILVAIMKENPDYIEDAVNMLAISRNLERLGDHATNIAEDVYFIVEAELVKHKYEKFLMSEVSTDDDDEKGDEE